MAARKLPSRTEGTLAWSGRRFREDTVVKYNPQVAQNINVGRRPKGSAPGIPSQRTCSLVFDGTTGREREYFPGQKTPGYDVPLVSIDSAEVTKGVMAWQYESKAVKWLGIPRFSTAAERRVPSNDAQPHLAGWEEISGYRCAKVVGHEASAPSASTIIWWIAPELDYMVLRRDEIRQMSAVGRRAQAQGLMRTVVAKVARLGDGCYLPTDVQFTVARSDPKGATYRTIRIFHFQARDLKVNEKIPDSYFALPKVKSAANKSGGGAGGCGFNAMVDFCRTLGVKLDDDEITHLAELYRGMSESSFADLSADLSRLLRSPVAGYGGLPERLGIQ